MSNEKKIEKITQYAQKGKIDKLQKFASSKDPELRAAAAKGMGTSNQDESYNTLVIMTRDADVTVRRAAVTALGEMGRKSGADHVRHAMTHDTDPEMIQACQQALAKILASDVR